MNSVLFPAITTTVPVGGTAVLAMMGPLAGGLILNPASASDQGLAVPENLYVDLINTAAPEETGTTFALAPGQAFSIPAGFTGKVSVNAATSGHQFSAYVIHGLQPVIPFNGTFPPSGPASLLNTIGSYLYQEYSDDDDLQAFVAAYNTSVQAYVDWFNQTNLPVYTGASVSGSLLDWVATGLYGYPRPILPSGHSQDIGPLNTWALNTIVLNRQEILGPPDFFVTSDDIYKRCLTWHFGKGDGKYFNIRWLKRRVMRFLTVENGEWGNVDQTYPVSVTFGTGNQVNINLQGVFRGSRGGAIMNSGVMNTFYLDEFDTFSVNIPVSPLTPIFKAAADAGWLELPFQFTWNINTEA